ncbi:MAG: EamA family transporter [Dysosmobacter sp.]
MKNKTFLANCALVLCAVIWGMNFIFQKQASQHLGAFTFISLRYYLGVLSLLPLFFYMRRRKALAALEAGEEVERWHGRALLAGTSAGRPALASWGGAVLSTDPVSMAADAPPRPASSDPPASHWCPVLDLLCCSGKRPPAGYGSASP